MKALDVYRLQMMKEKKNAKLGLFEVLRDKFKPQHNETILLQFCKIAEEQSENAENGWATSR